MSYVDNYEVLELIGRGSFGQIRKVRRKKDGHILVRKEIAYHLMTDKERTQLTSECGILAQVKHPNIVRYYHRDHVKADSTLHLYMEYCGNGDLSKTIRACRNDGTLLPEPMVWTYFTQILLALYRCHNGINPPDVGNVWSTTRPLVSTDKNAVKILHRDLKPENIFLGQDNDVKLGDFGLSKMLSPEQHLAKTYVGTPYYMSPEIVSDLSYTHKSDIWSLGCIIYELCSLSPPFNAKTQWSLIEKIKSGQYQPIPRQYSAELRNIIDMCLKIDPRQRPDTAELLEMDISKLFRKERELILMRRELKAMEDQLQDKEEELRRNERMLLLQAEDMRKEFDERSLQIHNEIDASLRQKWEILAQKEIRRQVEFEVEARTQAQVAVRLEAELENRIKELDLVPRGQACSGTGSLGSSGVSSGFSYRDSPPRTHFDHIPQSPADITMASPSVAGTPGARHNIMDDGPPKFQQMLPSSDDEPRPKEMQHTAPPPITPCRVQTVTAPMSVDIHETGENQSVGDSTTQVFKRVSSAYPNGSPVKVASGRRNGFQRAVTTSCLFEGPDKKGFGLGGSGESLDDIAMERDTGPPAKAQAGSTAESAQTRWTRDPPAEWDKSSEDVPSPFLKRVYS